MKNMRVCEKCQIKIEDNEKYCPICGKEIEGMTETSGAEEETSRPLYETQNLDFSGWLKNLLQQKGFTAAVIFSVMAVLVSIVSMFVMNFTATEMILSAGSISGSAVYAAALAMLYSDRNDRKNNMKTIKAMKILKVLALLQMILIFIIVALFIVAGVGIILGGASETLQSLLPFELYFVDTEMLPVVGISLILGSLLAAAVTAPFMISSFNLTRSIIKGVEDGKTTKIKGAAVYRIYNIIMFVSSMFMALSTLTLPETETAVIVVSFLSTVSAAFPGFLTSGIVSRLDKIMQMEMWKNR